MPFGSTGIPLRAADERYPRVDSPDQGLTPTEQANARGNIGISDIANSFSPAKKRIETGASNVEILVIGDSTGDAINEWPYLFAQWLAAAYPTHTVKYSAWNDGTNTYPTPSTVATGSGPRTIALYNASIPGSTPQYLMSDKFAAAISARAPHLIIWNHGHNITTQTLSVRLGRFIGPCEQVRKQHPGVPHAMFAQNPRRDDTVMDPVIASLKRYILMRRDVLLIDAYTKFATWEKSFYLYLDSVHPNSNGQPLFLDAITAEWLKAPSADFTTASSWLDTVSSNLLLNGNFAGFAGALPDSWSKGGDGTVSKEISIVAPGDAYSVKLVNGSTATYISQNIDATPYRNSTVTIAVRMYIGASAGNTAGRVRVSCNGTVPVVEVNDTGSDALNGWRWVVVPGVLVAQDATTLSVFLYANSTAGQSGTVYYSRAVLVPGDIPSNMA